MSLRTLKSLKLDDDSDFAKSILLLCAAIDDEDDDPAEKRLSTGETGRGPEISVDESDIVVDKVDRSCVNMGTDRLAVEFEPDSRREGSSSSESRSDRRLEVPCRWVSDSRPDLDVLVDEGIGR
jgi:hypothetical protein